MPDRHAARAVSAAAPDSNGPAALLLAVCGAASFLGALLLFWIQPLVAKLLLPLLGGSPAVWNTCLAFFQAGLLGGYLYAHLGARWLGPRSQAGLHAGLFGFGLFLPVALAPGLQPPTEDWRLVPWLLGTLAVTVGPPFLAVAGTAPMVQRWFSASGHRRARDPYFLYAASNAGSFAALAGFLLLFEPLLTLADQSRAWGAGYALLAVLPAACAAVARKAAAKPDPAAMPSKASPTAPASRRERAWWLALAFVPSSLLLGLTTHVTSELAAVPLFWVVPLGLYLLTFVAAFAKCCQPLVRFATAVQPLALVLLALAPLSPALDDWRLLLPLHLVAFVLSAQMCHGRLTSLRPPPARLTEFYLWIAAGGALGGLFNALLAPLLFANVEEYPLILAAACLLRPGAWPGRRGKLAGFGDLAVPAVAAAAVLWPAEPFALAGIGWPGRNEGATLAFMAAAPILLWLGRGRPLRLGLAVGALLFAGMADDLAAPDIVHRARTFFGTLKVKEDRDAGLRLLYHGTTRHGAQYLASTGLPRPNAYYHPTGPAGQVLTQIGAERTAEVAVVGLGTGTLACYGQRGERWRFFEIDRAVERIARDERFFSYLARCPPAVEVVLGDARLSLARESDGRFGVIVLDAFSSHAIPVHLLTREAFALYLRKLAPRGLLLAHVTNRHYDLAVPLARTALSLGLVGLQRRDPGWMLAGDYKSSSHWVLLARDRGDLAFLDSDPRWRPLPQAGGGRGLTISRTCSRRSPDEPSRKGWPARRRWRQALTRPICKGRPWSRSRPARAVPGTGESPRKSRNPWLSSRLRT